MPFLNPRKILTEEIKKRYIIAVNSIPSPFPSPQRGEGVGEGAKMLEENSQS
jgi:hypothetical protein